MPATSKAKIEDTFQFDPLKEFYIPGNDAKDLTAVIMAHGGKCTLKLPSEDYDGKKNNTLVICDNKRRIVYKNPTAVDANNKPIRNYLKTYMLQYIRDCIEQKKNLDPTNYENSYKAAVRFTPHEDQYILERARRESNQMNSHMWFASLANAPEMGDHTGESIRSRFRRFLKPKLGYVFQLDEKNVPIKDLNGDFIRVPVNEYQMKIPFTAKDDYLCCNFIIEEEFKAKKVHGSKDSIYLDKNARLTTSTFGAFRRLSKVPATRHTLNSWRDRYRKYLNPYGISAYKEYYERCLEKGQTPMAVHVAPQYESGQDPSSVDANIFAAQHAHLQQLGASASSTSAASVAAAAVVAAAANKDIGVSEELVSDPTSELSNKRRRTRSDYGLGNQTIHGAQVQTADLIRRSKRARGLPPSLAEAGNEGTAEDSLSPPVEVRVDEDVEDVLRDDEEDEEDEEEQEEGTVVEDEDEIDVNREKGDLHTSHSPEIVDGGDISHILKKEGADAQKPVRVIYVRVSPNSDDYIPLAAEYALQWVLKNQLFKKKFEVSEETVAKIEELRTKTDDAYEVIYSLKRLGFKKLLFHHLLMASSGSIDEFVEGSIVIVKRMLRYSKSLGKLKFSSVIRLKKIPGLWHQEYDVIVDANKQAIIDAATDVSVLQTPLVDVVKGVEGLPGGLTVGQAIDRIRFLDAYYGADTNDLNE